jgi:hypothetical protein
LTMAMAKLMKAKEDMPGAWLSQSSGAETILVFFLFSFANTFAA